MKLIKIRHKWKWNWLLLGGCFLPAWGWTQTQPWPLHVIDDSSLGADGARFGDINEDGLPDLVVGWEQGGIVRVYLNPGNRDVVAWQFVSLPAPQVEDAFMTDVNRDGRMDVVSFSEGSYRRIVVHLAPLEGKDLLDSTKWHSVAIQSTVQRTQWMFGVPMLLSGGRKALVVGAKGEGALVGLLILGREYGQDPGNISLLELAPAGWIMSLELADLNGDGLEDLVFTDRKGPQRGLRYLLQPDDPTHTSDPDHWKTGWIGMDTLNPMFLGWDRAGGVLQVPDEKGGIYLFNQTGMGPEGWTFTEKIALPEWAGDRPKSAVPGDMDGDGGTDWVYTTEGAQGKAGVVARVGTAGNWLDISGPAGIKYDFATLIDMDRDGDLDVVTCEEANNAREGKGLGVIWYENPFR